MAFYWKSFLKTLSLWQGKFKVRDKVEKAELVDIELVDKKKMLESIIYEFDKSRKIQGTWRNRFFTVQLSKEAINYLEALVRKNREEIGVKEILNSLSHKPYRSVTRKA